MAEQFDVEMTYSKSTKGTHVFVAPADAKITSLYIRKEAFGSEAPKTITVTVK